ncbi:MAG TPA: response regulator [Pseudolabrys sp.]|nr:response regulator [Pseudolabrys sp.]
MTPHTINFRELIIGVADVNAYFCSLLHGMLRGFGAHKVIEIRDGRELLQALSDQKLDALLCDARLPPYGGLKLTHAIRHNQRNENRTIPILLLSGDARAGLIKTARDFGANMVLTKPTSPASLYDRLAWIAFNPRKFVNATTYFGPDRRFKIEGFPGGIGRRKADKAASDVGAPEGPPLSQGDIDNLFTNAKGGDLE